MCNFVRVQIRLYCIVARMRKTGVQYTGFPHFGNNVLSAKGNQHMRSKNKMATQHPFVRSFTQEIEVLLFQVLASS